MSICSYCQGVIRFVRLDTGRPIPVEPVPYPDRGNVAARWQGSTLAGYVISRTKPLQDGYQQYIPHRANCDPAIPRHTADDRTPTLLD